MKYDLNRLKDTLYNSSEIAACYLFGSAARNELVVNDLDLLIVTYTETDKFGICIELAERIAASQNISPDQIDILLFDLQLADPQILYRAVDQGILLKNEDYKLLTDKIEALSLYFLENEFLIRQAKQLEKERLEAFYADA
jgi:predicted nucleotidyltransferase